MEQAPGKTMHEPLFSITHRILFYPAPRRMHPAAGPGRPGADPAGTLPRSAPTRPPSALRRAGREASPIERGPGGGQYGACSFSDNRQCEEWALLRGECPKGGIRVAGYATPAARYCGITGGRYAVVARSGRRRLSRAPARCPAARPATPRPYCTRDVQPVRSGAAALIRLPLCLRVLAVFVTQH